MKNGQAGGRSESWLPPGPAWLFCPADRPERYQKAADRSDVVILDLEDAVAPTDKAAARDALISTPLDPERTVVRVNAFGSEDHARDLEAVERTEYRTLMLAKTTSAQHIAELAPRGVIALVESALGAVNVFETLSAENAVGAMWGAEDLTASLGGNASRTLDGKYRDVARHVRSQVLLAAKARGLLALDSVYVDIGDLDGLRVETDDAVAVGFDAKVAIHPSQVPVIRDAYKPTQNEIDWAEGLLAAVSSNRGVFTYRGQMVDEPVLLQARRIIARSN
ncbi:putative citrate lyase beta subunit [Rhodococcoides trifolii]|uniref:Citrate lyase beta subunit n=1 Tax=Rhodococcoides trifolii TaxID=908250 RepID=A0A917FZY9_9NOCA|nr:CoA ester lyase [Rhodococcus trifolii]GGG16062.1 putative citrate lyase beta subunit [Rhodococcus trifolii]